MHRLPRQGCNSITVNGSSDLVDIVEKSVPGDTMILTVYRQGQTLELTVTIEEQIQSALENTQEPHQINPGNRMPGFPYSNR